MPSAFRHFVLAFLIAALIFGIVGAMGRSWFGKAVREKEKNKITDSTQTEDEDGSGDEGQDSSDKPMLRGQSFSILMILNDYQPDRYDYGIPDNYTGIVRPRLKQATSLIYLRYSRETAKLTSAIIPTDTKLMVDGVAMTAAEAYHYKDGAYLANRISSQLGIRINYYLDATYDEFVSIINGSYMNGITLSLPTEVKVTLRSGTSLTLKAGNQYLDGERTLALLGEGVFEDKVHENKVRLEIAHAILEKLTTLENKRNPKALYDAVISRIKTNLTENQLSSNTDMMFAYFDLEQEILSVPGGYDDKGYYVINTEEAMKLFRPGTALE